LINIECIDEIADIAGRGEQVAQITEAAMRGEIKDFKHSLIERVKLLQGVSAEALEQVYVERLQLNYGAEQLIQQARKQGIYTLLVSGGFTFFTERLQARLGLDQVQANTLEIIDGVLTGRVLGPIVDGAAKAQYVAELARKLDAQPEQMIAIGDGANDLQIMLHTYYSVDYRAKHVVQYEARFTMFYCGVGVV